MRKMTKFLILGIMLLSLAVFTNDYGATSSVVAQSSDRPVVLIDLAHGNSHAGYGNEEMFVSLLLDWGYDVIIIGNDDAGSYVITDTLLEDVDVLILNGLYSGSWSTAEMTAIADWFNNNENKAIWASGDSDYDGTNLCTSIDDVLDECGSSIFVEPGEVQDAVQNIGDAGYRPANNGTDAYESGASEIIDSINGLDVDIPWFMHGPTNVVGRNGTTMVGLENGTLPDNVEVVLRYNGSATYTQNKLPTGWEFHAIDSTNEHGFVAMASQDMAGDNGTGKIVAAGEAMWNGYKGMIGWNGTGYYEEKGNLVNNMFIVNATMEWLAPRGTGTGSLMKYVEVTNTETVTETSNVTVTEEVTATTKMEYTATTTVETTKDDSDGFGLIIAVTSLSLVAIFLIRRRK
jgi:hypothetical protein